MDSGVGIEVCCPDEKGHYPDSVLYPRVSSMDGSLRSLTGSVAFSPQSLLLPSEIVHEPLINHR